MNEAVDRRQKITGWIETYSLNPEPYVILGTAHPERALLNIPEFCFRGDDFYLGSPIVVLASVINGRVFAHVYTEGPRDVGYLRVCAWNAISGQVAIVSFLCGYAFSVEITQIVHFGQGLNYVYAADGDGNGIGCGDDWPNRLERIRKATTGRLGAYITRCLSDLSMALQHPGDSAFYCFRAIESLKRHCVEAANLAGKSDAVQWEEFRRQADCTKDFLLKIKSDADPVRHGNHLAARNLSRESVMEMTRMVVTSYLDIAGNRFQDSDANADMGTAE